MEMHQIRYFIAMVEHLNFTRAAEACHVSQPSLTRAIRNLEDELGGLLFRHEGRRTHLTELGKMVQPRLERVLSLTEVARNEALDFSTMTNAKLTLGCMCTIAPTSIMCLIEFFSQQVPQLHLNLREAPGSKVVELLMEGELDVAIAALPDYPELLYPQRLFDESYVVSFPSGHRFEALEDVRVDDLRGERYLKRINCEYLDFFEAAGHEYHYATDHRFQSEHESWVQAMVVAGLGCAILPESLATHPGLKHRPLIEPKLSRTVSVVTRRGRSHTPVVDFFVTLCKKVEWTSPST